MGHGAWLANGIESHRTHFLNLTPGLAHALRPVRFVDLEDCLEVPGQLLHSNTAHFHQSVVRLPVGGLHGGVAKPFGCRPHRWGYTGAARRHEGG